MTAGDAKPFDSIRNIVLVGYRGSGKTSVARRLARKLGWTCIDTDEQIEQAAKKTIRAIFAEDGEAAFRVLEREAIAEALENAQRVISVGGGAITHEDNRAQIKSAATCVWLSAPAEVLYARITADERTADTRPALTERTGLAEVEHVLAERTPLYEAVADERIDTAGLTIEQVADTILARLAARA